MLHVHLCVNPSAREVFHLVKRSLGTYCGQKGQTDIEIKTAWHWDKTGVRGHICWFSYYDTLSPLLRGEWVHGGNAFSWWMHYQTNWGSPHRGAFWRVNILNSYANHYTNCILEGLLAHCELFHSKQPWPKLWIMTTPASARICKQQASDRQSLVSGRFREKGAKSDKERGQAEERGRDGCGRTDRRYASFLHNYSHQSHHSQSPINTHLTRGDREIGKYTSCGCITS